MATKPGYLYHWPWEKMGNYKYTLLAPLAAGHLPLWIAAPLGIGHMRGSEMQAYFDFILGITLVRYAVMWLFQLASRYDAISKRTRIQDQDFGFEQVDQEDDWDNVHLSNCLAFCALYFVPVTILAQRHSDFPLFDWRGFAMAAVIHAGPVEFIYYWFHRALHTGYLWKSYHSHHHSSYVTEPISGNSHPLFENTCYMALFSLALVVPWYNGVASIGLFYVYAAWFDFMNALGHCNFEFLPRFVTQAPMKYFLYTPSFHSLHHSRVHTNYCLFMPYCDFIFGTVHDLTETTYDHAIRGDALGNINSAANSAPDAVFLIHGGLSIHTFQMPFVSRSQNAHPMKASILNIALSMILDNTILALSRAVGFHSWLGKKTFRFSQATLARGKPNQVRTATWAFFMDGKDYMTRNLNQRKEIALNIENAVLDADRRGVRVTGLGALNKAHWINHGGDDILKHHPHLRTRVVHGNTMTAAAVYASVPRGTTDCVMTGCTSKVGRALAIKLALDGCTVHMITASAERFLELQNEVRVMDEVAARRLVHQTKLDAPACRQAPVWIIGKWMQNREQKHIPKGGVVLNYCFPPPPALRHDVTYVACASLQIDAKVVTGVHATTADLERNTWYACNCGTVVHALEGWTHHEVGAVDVSQIDVCWKAAQKYGFRLSDETLEMLEARNQPDEVTPKIRDSLVLMGGASPPLLDSHAGGSAAIAPMIKSTDALPIWTMERFRREAGCVGADATSRGTKPLLAIDGHVVDVTSFLDEHPGGESLLKKFYGLDASDAFGGGIYDHSRAARKRLNPMRIAELEVLPVGSV